MFYQIASLTTLLEVLMCNACVIVYLYAGANL